MDNCDADENDDTNNNSVSIIILFINIVTASYYG